MTFGPPFHLAGPGFLFVGAAVLFGWAGRFIWLGRVLCAVLFGWAGLGAAVLFGWAGPRVTVLFGHIRNEIADSSTL